MRCDEVKDMLDLYVDGELTEEIRRKIDRHLLGCTPCGGEVHALIQTGSMLKNAISAAEVSPAFRERAAARLLNALAPSLRPIPEPEMCRQWSLPLLDSASVRG